ncbi:hypothetical protein CAC42_7412 [Sphaceloma murrayae]|uniref:2-dehydropantoate 2-reductase n=1 Tax=Sphaceloma murrayae TaxID=2082308 RepID=A0A2K1QWZ2_9PEZI|nr:hypothetical protein CAC42_7412 [Sphaceloma murrayae]
MSSNTPQSPGYASDADQQHSEQAPTTIHIVGLGAIGKLVAHSLRSIPDSPPVTLIAHRPGLLAEWRRSKREIVIEEDGHRTARSGFEMELSRPPKRFFGVPVKSSDEVEFIYENPEGLPPHEAAAQLKRQRGEAPPIVEDVSETNLQPGESNEPIHHLIITVKVHLTVSALASLKHRLLPSSTICFLQNGMGVLDEINQHVFPNPDTRPNYLMGIVSHGANTPAGSPFFAIHAGKGTIALSVMPRTARPEIDVSTHVDFAPTSRYLMRTLTRSPILAAVGVPPVEFLQQRLEKLAQNAVINPLTVLADARNGALNYNFAFTKVERLLLAEISLVLRSLPELQGLPNVANRFSADRLETLVVSIANKTRLNISSMLADARAGRPTEIRYINGYIIRRGEELGISCVCNYLVQQMVVGKIKMIQDEMTDRVVLEEPADHRPARG